MSGPTISHDGPWTLGIKVGLPFACAGTLLLIAWCVVMVVGSVRADDTTRSYSDAWTHRKMYRVWSWVPFLLLFGFVGGMVAAYWPTDASYHQYRDVSGTVQKVSSRFQSAGDNGGTDQTFVVTFQGSPQPYAVSDTRAALLKPGDRLTIACIRDFDYAANAGYSCKWRSESTPGGER